jgi:hypothetical protein
LNRQGRQERQEEQKRRHEGYKGHRGKEKQIKREDEFQKGVTIPDSRFTIRGFLNRQDAKTPRRQEKQR